MGDSSWKGLNLVYSKYSNHVMNYVTYSKGNIHNIWDRDSTIKPNYQNLPTL